MDVVKGAQVMYRGAKAKVISNPSSGHGQQSDITGIVNLHVGEGRIVNGVDAREYTVISVPPKPRVVPPHRKKLAETPTPAPKARTITIAKASRKRGTGRVKK